MAQIDNEFVDFLKAYEHTSSLNALDTDTVSESRVNAILNRHKHTFDAWLKCPGWLKDKYHNKIPYDILEKAAANPNFTEAETMQADIEHEKKSSNPEPENSDLSTSDLDILSQNPIYSDLAAHDVKFTHAHVVAMKENIEIYKHGGYSSENAEKVAFEIAARKAIDDQIKAIKQDQTKSEEEKIEQIKVLENERKESKPRQLSFMQAEVENHPERAIIRLLWKMQKDQLPPQDVTLKMQNYMQDILVSDKLTLLSQEMAGSKYQKVIRTETKDFFANILREYGLNPSTLEPKRYEQTVKDKIEALRGRIKRVDQENNLSSDQRHQLRKEQYALMEAQLSPEELAKRKAKQLDRDKIMAARLGIIPEYKTKTLTGKERIVQQDEALIKDGNLNEARISKEQFDALVARKKELEGK